MKLEFSRQNFRKILKYHISWKFVQSEPMDRPNDMTKLAFCEDAVRPPVHGLQYGLNILGGFSKINTESTFTKSLWSSAIWWK
jgi:hypothetical protein